MAKKLLVILFGALILVGSTEIHQLLKFPLLIQHYLQHRKKDTSLSFIEFIKIHYTDKAHPNDNDDSEDGRLPFKSIDGISHIDTPPVERIENFQNFYLQRTLTAFYPEGIPNHQSISIFHPPRLHSFFI
jgi:hypothetical protein